MYQFVIYKREEAADENQDTEDVEKEVTEKKKKVGQ